MKIHMYIQIKKSRISIRIHQSSLTPYTKTSQVTDFASMQLALAKPKTIVPNIYYLYNTAVIILFLIFPAPTLFSQCYTL